MINPQLQGVDPYGNQVDDLGQFKQGVQQNNPIKVMPQGNLIKVGDPSLNPNIKPSGAPVNFNPRQTQTINSVFGMPVNNSFDRSMPVIPQDIPTTY